MNKHVGGYRVVNGPMVPNGPKRQKCFRNSKPIIVMVSLSFVFVTSEVLWHPQW